MDAKMRKKKTKIQKMFLRRCSPAGHSSMIFSPMNSDESIVYACPCEPLNTRCVMSRSAGSWCCGAVLCPIPWHPMASHGIPPSQTPCCPTPRCGAAAALRSCSWPTNWTNARRSEPVDASPVDVDTSTRRHTEHTEPGRIGSNMF